jgi:hypothetical protein
VPCTRRLIDGRVAIVSHVDDRQPSAVAHDRAQERLEHRTGRAAAGVDEEPGPAPVVGSRQELRVLGKEPLDHFVATQDDGRRQRANAAGEEQACRVGIAVQRRLIERREADGVLEVLVGAELDQRGDGGRLPLGDRQVQRRPPEVRPVHALIQIRAVRGQRAQRRHVAHRGRRHHCVPRAMLEQVASHIELHRVVEADRPAEHVEIVRRAGADWIRAVLDEQPDDGEIAALGGEMDRIRVVAVVADVRIGAALEEQAHDCFVAHAEVERRPPARVGRQLAALVDDGRVAVEDRADGGGVARAGCREQRRQRRVRRGAIAHRAREGNPAVVSPLARERVLHVAQRGLLRRARGRAIESRARVRIARAEGVEPALGGFAQVVEGGHGRLLPFVPGVRLPQAGRRFDAVDRTGWVGGDSLAADRRRPSAR